MLSANTSISRVSLTTRSMRPMFVTKALRFGGFGGGGHGGAGGRGGGRGGGGGGGGRDGDGSDRPQKWLLAGAFAGALQMSLLAGPAHAARKGAEPLISKDLTIESVVDTLWSLAGPMLTNLGFSGVMGFASGMALKMVGKFLAVSVGLLFILLQGLAYSGIITVNWSHMNEMVENKLDVNKDGKLDGKDFKMLVSSGLTALSVGVPSVGGFLAGFMLGIKM